MTEPTQREQALQLAETLKRAVAPFDPWGSFAGTNSEVAKICDALILSEAEKQTMRQAIENAPHAPGCSFREWECGQLDCDETHSTPCNCWKSRALSGSTPTPCTTRVEKDRVLDDCIRQNAAQVDRLVAEKHYIHQLYTHECNMRLTDERTVADKQGEIERLRKRERELLSSESAFRGDVQRMRDALQILANRRQKGRHHKHPEDCPCPIHVAQRALSGSPADPQELKEI